MPVPNFYVPHVVRNGETLTSIATKHMHANPGPIIAFNADRLPGALVEVGERRQLTPEFIEHNKRMKNYGDGPQDPNYANAWKRMGANQITDAVLSTNNPAMGAGRILTVRTEYPISAPMIEGVLEIPWTRKALREFVRVLTETINETIRETNLAVNGQTEALKDLKATFIAADLFFAAITLPLSAVKGWQATTTAIANGKQAMNMFEAVWPVIVEQFMRTGGAAWDVAQQQQLKAAALDKMPAKIKLEKDLDYYIDNYISFLTPSRLATYYYGFKEQDTDVMRYGEAAIDARTKNKIIDEGQKQIDRMQSYIRVAQLAISASFYDHIVRDVAPVVKKADEPRPRSSNRCSQPRPRFHGTPVSSGPFPRFRGE